MRLSGWLHELGLRQLIQRRRRGYLQFGHVRRNIAVLQETQDSVGNCFTASPCFARVATTLRGRGLTPYYSRLSG